MKKTSGKSFVTIMIVVAIVALILRFTLSQFISINIAQNQSAAQLTLKLISTALENFARDKLGTYPSDFSLLIKNNPAYLDRDYLSESPIKGYIYNCTRLESSSYSCSAIPANCMLTGCLSFAVNTGGVVVSEDCKKKNE